MGGTTGSDTGTTRAADGQQEQAAAPETPPTSPRIQEVAEGNPVREALVQAEAERRKGTFGTPGRPLNPRSPFLIAMKATAGVLTVIALAELLLKARSVLILIGLAFFIAAGLDPVVVWLTRHGLRRWMAVIIVLLALLALVGGFIAAAIPPVASQTTTLIRDLPHYAQQLQNHDSTLGRLNGKYHVQQRISSLLGSKGSELAGGVIGAGQIVWRRSPSAASTTAEGGRGAHLRPCRAAPLTGRPPREASLPPAQAVRPYREEYERDDAED